MGLKMEYNPHIQGMSLLPYYIQAVPLISLQLLPICASITEGRIWSPFLPCCQLVVVVQPCQGSYVCCDPASSGLLFPKEECCAGSVHGLFSAVTSAPANWRRARHGFRHWLMIIHTDWWLMFCLDFAVWQIVIFLTMSSNSSEHGISVRMCSHRGLCMGLLFSGQTQRELWHVNTSCVVLLDQEVLTLLYLVIQM